MFKTKPEPIGAKLKRRIASDQQNVLCSVRNKTELTTLSARLIGRNAADDRREDQLRLGTIYSRLLSPLASMLSVRAQAKFKYLQQ